MRWITCCIYGLFLIYPLASSAEPYLYENVTLDIPDGWSKYKDPYNNDVGVGFHQEHTGNLMAFILRKGILSSGGDPSAFLKTHPVEHPVSSIQVGKYSGYFVTFSSEGKCLANWFLGDGHDLLIAHFQGNCNSADFTPVIKVIESIEPVEGVVD
ncbi:hypothetical protein [Microbulbifer variabilis]|uniref:hypothetical protein n=1 Tax=Microbulbifer variabilis TaxID=266805 RepID=UPI001CFCE0F0|nr:hypothetical protein [Microbulbifer variabilis]